MSVLVVKPGALGDTILSLPLVSSIRAKHPAAEVTFLGTRSYRDLLPEHVRFQAIDDPCLLWLFSDRHSAGPGEGPKYDYAYLVLTRPDDVVMNLRNAGTERIMHVSPRPPTGKHVVQSVHEGLGLTVPARLPALLRLVQKEKKDLIWLHPGSGGPTKCLPLDLMASYADQLRKQTGWPLAVTVGEEDAFLKRDPAWGKLVAGSDTLVLENRPQAEVCARLGGAKLFVGNDSGISHLAVGLGIRAIIFFVSTDPANWAPWVPEHQLCIVDLRNAGSDYASRLSVQCDWATQDGQMAFPAGAAQSLISLAVEWLLQRNFL